MGKLKLSLDPTFKAKVDIPVPGKGTDEVEFIFKGRDRDSIKAFVESIPDKEDVDLIMEMASGWDLDEPFDRDGVTTMVKLYVGSTRAVLEKYLSEVAQARLGNWTRP